MPRQLLVSQARPGRIPGSHLPLKQISQQLHRVGISIQREAQIRRQLPHHIVLRIVAQDQQILFQRVRGLAFLQKLLRTLHALPYFGSVQSFCDLRHAELSGVNPAPILGATPTPSNAVTPRLDYEGHARRRHSALEN